MAKQRNEPNDPAAELADYDFTKSTGSSADGGGDMTVEEWPSELDKSEFRPSGHVIVPNWVKSTYNEPTKSNIREFAKTIDDYTEPTVAINVLKATQHKLKQSHLSPAERLSIFVLAYEDSKSYTKLAEKYPVSSSALENAQYAFDRIIEQHKGSVTKQKLEEEIEIYTESKDAQSEIQGSSAYQKAKPKLVEYFENNPNASIDEAIDAVDYDVKWNSVNSLQANLVKHGHIDPDGKKEDKEKDSENTDDFHIDLDLEKQEARQIVLEQELSEDIQEEIVETILEKVGL